MRTVAVAVTGALFVLALFADGTAVAQADKAVKAQMVKGTIKKVDTDANVLIVNQKLKKGEVVERQLDITAKVEFLITKGAEKKTAFGRDGLLLLEGQEGSSVQVKCDKDVNVLKVSVRLKK
jgi:hypothetical protein